MESSSSESKTIDDLVCPVPGTKTVTADGDKKEYTEKKPCGEEYKLQPILNYSCKCPPEKYAKCTYAKEREEFFAKQKPGRNYHEKSNTEGEFK